MASVLIFHRIVPGKESQLQVGYLSFLKFLQPPDELFPETCRGPVLYGKAAAFSDVGVFTSVESFQFITKENSRSRSMLSLPHAAKS